MKRNVFSKISGLWDSMYTHSMSDFLMEKIIIKKLMRAHGA